jgi:hypothetical protein
VAKRLYVKRQEDLNYHLTMLVLTAPAAALVWFVFHAVYADLSRGEKAVGYVDPMMQTGILLGYYTMIGGTIVLGAFAAWSAIQSLRLLLKRRR